MEEGYSVGDVEYISPKQRIKDLKEELAQLEGGWNPNKALTQFVQNPGKLAEMFHLSPEQSLNVSSLITGAASAASRKYLTALFGAELAGAIGGFAGAYLSRRVIGR